MRFEIRAAAIHARICNTGKPMAVFYAGGQIKVHSIATDTCERRMVEQPEALVGIYDYDSDEGWIAEDLEYVIGKNSGAGVRV
jgi:hypothetical protein